jgi:hypothetical protein
VTVEAPHPHSWSDWYRFARSEFGYEHDECVEYANLRFVEEQNRGALRARQDIASQPVRTRHSTNHPD